MERGVLYLISTPIGNLGDTSARALETLRSVEVVYAEDTRHTLGLLRHFGIETSLRSLYAHNEASRTERVLEGLEAGRDCAIVADAGTPGVSDPGIHVVRAAADRGLKVVAIPGPSAVLTALAVSGFAADRFLFLGFAPRRGSARADWLTQFQGAATTVVVFESPRRLQRLLADLVDQGLGEVQACVCRELTKVFEEVRRGTVETLADYYADREVRGEITLVTERPGPSLNEVDLPGAREEARRLAAAGGSTRAIAEALRSRFGMTRNEAYETALRVGEHGEAAAEDR